MARVEDAVLKNLQVFVAFARNRLGDHHLAEDVVQESLIKALAADRHPETDEETTTWFYRILRRSIIDIYRKEDARGRAMERFENEFLESPDKEDEGVLCQCFRRLMPLVPEQYRKLLEEVDLKTNRKHQTKTRKTNVNAAGCQCGGSCSCKPGRCNCAACECK